MKRERTISPEILCYRCSHVGVCKRTGYGSTITKCKYFADKNAITTLPPCGATQIWYIGEIDPDTWRPIKPAVFSDTVEVEAWGRDKQGRLVAVWDGMATVAGSRWLYLSEEEAYTALTSGIWRKEEEV